MSRSCRVRRATVAAARGRPSHRCRSRWTRWRRPWSPPLSPVATLPYCLSGVYHQGRHLSLQGCSLIRTVQRQPINLSTYRPNRKTLRYVAPSGVGRDSLSFSFASSERDTHTHTKSHPTQIVSSSLTFTFTFNIYFYDIIHRRSFRRRTRDKWHDHAFCLQDNNISLLEQQKIPLRMTAGIDPKSIFK